jgi:hypothetical protein
MKTFLIVYILYEFGDAFIGFLPGFIFEQIYFLCLYGLDETLGKGVIKGTTLATHTDGGVVGFQAFCVFRRGILDSTVRMMNQTT